MNASTHDRALAAKFFFGIQSGDLAMIDDILKNNRTSDDFGPNVFLKNTRQTALHVAVNALDIDMVRLLLSHGANPDICDEFGHTPLHVAVVVGGANLVRSLVEGGADVNARSGSGGETPIQKAALQPHHDGIVFTLIKGGADLDVKNKEGQNLAHLAARSGNARTATILIMENGVHPGLRDNNGRKPADLATTDIFRCLFQKWEEMHREKLTLVHRERLKKLDVAGQKMRRREPAS